MSASNVISIIPALNKEQSALLLSSIMESKLTRTELMDFVIDKLTEDIKAKRDAVGKEMDELERVKLTTKEIKTLVKDAPFTTGVSADRDTKKFVKNGVTEWGYVYNGYSLTLTQAAKVPMAQMPKHFVAARERLRELKVEKDALDTQLRTVEKNRRRARSELVRQALEGTKEGRAIMAAVSDMKSVIAQKLLG